MKNKIILFSLFLISYIVLKYNFVSSIEDLIYIDLITAILFFSVRALFYFIVAKKNILLGFLGANMSILILVLLLVIDYVYYICFAKGIFEIIISFDTNVLLFYIFLQISLLMLIVLLVLPIIKNVVNCIKDYINGTNHIIIEKYKSNIILGSRYKPTYYIIKGTDINGNKIELRSRNDIFSNMGKVKINFYNNINWVESFDYYNKEKFESRLLREKMIKKNKLPFIYNFTITFIILLPILMYILSDILLNNYNVLLGIIFGDISVIIMFLYSLIFMYCFLIPYIKKRKHFIYKLFTFFYGLISVFVLIYFSINFVYAIVDSFQGTKELYLVKYETKDIRGRRLNPSYDVVTGYDKEGNKYKLDSYKFISEYEDMGLKIKYYENIGVIESFEYLEK